MFLHNPNQIKKNEQVCLGCQHRQHGSSSSPGDEERDVPPSVQPTIEGGGLSATEGATVAALRIRWFGLHPGEAMSDEMILRFARSHMFREQRAWAAMRRVDPRYLSLTARGLERQLRKRLVFPLPAVATKDGQECFYMRHSRFHPDKSPMEDAIDPLVYVINTMNEKERNMANGIALISNFDGWTIDQFSMEYFFLLVTVLQGGVVPVNISSWMIVNAPPFFNQFFVMMKRMMTPAFQRRVHFVAETGLGKRLRRGYRNHLPRDVARGRAITKEIVSDFIDARAYVESFQPCASENSVGKETSRDAVKSRATTREFILDFADPQKFIETLRDCTSETPVEKGTDFHASESSTDVTFDLDGSTSFHYDDLQVTWRRLK